jgi:hypothetical protein
MIGRKISTMIRIEIDCRKADPPPNWRKSVQWQRVPFFHILSLETQTECQSIAPFKRLSSGDPML